MADWIPLTFASERPASAARDLNIDLIVSPYDVPEAARGYFNPENTRFVIEFKYLGTEPKEARPTEHKEINLQVGKNSGRLYGIEIDANAVPGQSVVLNVGVQEIDKALKQLIDHPIRSVRLDNYLMVQEALQKQDLLHNVATAG